MEKIVGVTPNSGVREVTDQEVDFFELHGWVKLDGLISSDLAARMLAWAQAELKPGSDPGRPTTNGRPPSQWRERRFLARDAGLQPFASVAFSRAFAHNAQRMGGRRLPARYWADIVTCKVPRGQQDASERTAWHQDLPTLPHDRVGVHTFWVAIDEVRPEQGALRFVDASHREGPLARVHAGDPDLLDQHRWLLDKHELSRPLHLQPGDATCHHSLTVHGAPPNTGSSRRWAFLITYFPVDVRYSGTGYPATDGLGLAPGSMFELDLFPVLQP